MRPTLPTCLAQPQAHGTRKTSRRSRKTLPRSGTLHLHTAESEAHPFSQSTLYSLGFFKTYHFSCVRACVCACFPGRMLLELLIFGNVAVLSESKHATRFRGQPQTFFLLPLPASFSPMLLCSLRLPTTEATGHQAPGSELSHPTAGTCLGQWGEREGGFSTPTLRDP